MFSMLKDLSIAQESKIVKPLARTGISLKALRAAGQHARVTARVERRLAEIRNTTNEYTDLRRLCSVLKVHGISKALMQFANPQNAFTSVVKNMPANESLDLVSFGANDARTTTALEGLSDLLAAEPRLISEWTHASADDIEDLLECTEAQLKDVGEAISQALMDLENAPSEDLLSTTVFAVTNDAAMARMDAMLDILPDFDAVVSNPTDRDGTDLYKAKIAEMIQKIGPYVGIATDPSNPYLIISGDMMESMQGREATLSELGYSVESIIALLKKADSLIDELNGLIERKEEMVSHLHETADAIILIDNDVPPGVDGAMEADDGNATEVPADGLSQADVYHCQVASHLYALTVILTVSVGMVEEALGLVHVADATEDDDDDDNNNEQIDVTIPVT